MASINTPRRTSSDGESDLEIGIALVEVVDALGDTLQSRLDLAETRVLERARAAGQRGMLALGVTILVATAWVCGATAVGLWLRTWFSAAETLAILAGFHLGAAALIASVLGAARTRWRPT